ncbi:testis-expressed protein 10 homolog [Chrysoperla carnea]|uniref:testis-expressed protein 10 homolog n=1 Tax=Chrysoperla carnea TaxID=189513 RepID=UPI001D097D87|nr:testis-expressed protein 10 homolog [Chrysoperla carnea]
MGKNARHKKVVKSERAKVKLKAKKLPKETNVTDTNFKIKKIIISKQLESHDGDLLTSKKLNIQDLLVRVRHYNVSSRTEALIGIRELISAYPTELIEKHLNALLENVTRLTTDIESSVRKQCYKVLPDILSSVPAVKIAPYYNLLISYLCCAMTHIKQNIQEDSLIFMDILIQKTPTLFPNYFIKIFPSFLNLISKVHNESKLDRKLSTTLNSKQTTVKWRTKVLQRLEDLLNAVVFKDNNRDLLNIKEVYVDKKYDKSCYNFFALYNYNILQSNVPLSMFCTVNTLNHGEDVLLKSVNIIIPLLFAIWIECKPNDENFQFESALSDEALSTLNHILKILKLIWIHLKCNGHLRTHSTLISEFYTQIDKNFGKQFVENFPYVKSENIRNHQQINNNRAGDSQCWEQNLEIVNLFLKFHPILRQQTFSVKHSNDVLEYLKNCLLNSRKLNQECTAILCEILKDCFSVEYNKLHKNDTHNILRMTIRNFNKNHFNENIRNDIFNLLCGVLENEKLAKCDEYQVFLKTLPIMLAKDTISMPILKTVAKLCRQNNQIVINGIKEGHNLFKIISNFEKFQLNMGKDEEDKGTPIEVLEQILYYIKK